MCVHRREDHLCRVSTAPAPLHPVHVAGCWRGQGHVGTPAVGGCVCLSYDINDTRGAAIRWKAWIIIQGPGLKAARSRHSRADDSPGGRPLGTRAPHTRRRTPCTPPRHQPCRQCRLSDRKKKCHVENSRRTCKKNVFGRRDTAAGPRLAGSLDPPCPQDTGTV